MDFIRKLFKREPEKISLTNIEIKDWLEEEGREVLSKENREIESALSSMESAKSLLKENLSSLENAGLMNPDIPEREKHIMEGNRQAYISRLQNYLEGLALPKADYSEIDNFCSLFHENLLKLNQETAKGYYILKHFFDKEMADIAAQLKNLESGCISLANLIKKGKIGEYRALLFKIRELNENSIEIGKLEREIEELETEIDETGKKAAQAQSKKDSLIGGQEYKLFKKSEKEKRDIEDAIEKAKNAMANSIMPLEKAIKKFTHGEKAPGLLSRYIENPVYALEDDKEFRLPSELEKLKDPILKGDIELKDKKKVLAAIDSITKESLKSARDGLVRLKEDLISISSVMERSSVMMDYKELEYQTDHLSNKLKKLREDLAEKKDKIESLETEKKSRRIEKAISEFSGKEVSITE